jgi:hypothetical protein
MSNKIDEQEKPWNAIVGSAPGDTMEEALGAYANHLKAHLQLPCEVTGIEDFNWEEPYVLGGESRQEYKELKETQPSFRDKYELLDLGPAEYSEWKMFDEDITAHVRRKHDGKEFDLGLSELKATDKKSANFRLLDDYSTWFANNL